MLLLTNRVETYCSSKLLLSAGSRPESERMGERISYCSQIGWLSGSWESSLPSEGKAGNFLVQQVLQSPGSSGCFQSFKVGVGVPTGDHICRDSRCCHVQIFFNGAKGEFHRCSGQFGAILLGEKQVSIGGIRLAIRCYENPFQSGFFLGECRLKGRGTES